MIDKLEIKHMDFTGAINDCRDKINEMVDELNFHFELIKNTRLDIERQRTEQEKCN